MEIQVYGQLRAATDGKTVTVTPDEPTVAGLVTALCVQYPRAKSQLLDESGDLRPSVRVMVDGETADLDTACPADADIKLFPAMQGG